MVIFSPWRHAPPSEPPDLQLSGLLDRLASLDDAQPLGCQRGITSNKTIEAIDGFDMISVGDFTVLMLFDGYGYY